MRRPKMFDQSARRIAVMGIAAKTLAPIVRDALKDRRVRSALDDAYGSGRRVYAEVRGSEPKHVAARVARDGNLQSELAAMVRAVARTFDEGVSATRRRAGRRFAMLAAIIGGVAAVVGLRRRRSGRPSRSERAQGGLNHGMTDADIVGRATSAPAGRGITEH